MLLVTGVSSGIGYAVAKAYDERGANVFGVDINKIKNSKKLSGKYNFFNCEVQNYNKMNNITPESIKKNIDEIIENVAEQDHVTVEIKEAKQLVGKDLEHFINKLEKQMLDFAAKLEFEEAARLRDEVNRLKAQQIGIKNPFIKTAILC